MTLGPAPGTEIWEKTLQLRSLVPTLETVLQVLEPGKEPNGVYPFDALLDTNPPR